MEASADEVLRSGLSQAIIESTSAFRQSRVVSPTVVPQAAARVSQALSHACGVLLPSPPPLNPVPQASFPGEQKRCSGEPAELIAFLRLALHSPSVTLEPSLSPGQRQDQDFLAGPRVLDRFG